MPCLFIGQNQTGLSTLFNKLAKRKTNHIFDISFYRNIKIYRIDGNIIYSNLIPHINFNRLIIVFSVTNRSSFNNIRAYKIDKVKTILLALKTDLRTVHSISYEEGRRRAYEINAQYFEISIYSEKSIDDLFDWIEKEDKIFYCC